MLDLAANIFKQIPENIDYENTAKILSVDPSPLNVVLLQEVRDYRSIGHFFQRACTLVQKSYCYTPCVRVHVGVGIQNVRANVKVLEFYFFCIFLTF